MSEHVVEATEEMTGEVEQETATALDLPGIIEQLKQKYPQIEVDEKLTVMVPGEALIGLMQELKDSYDLDHLSNLTAVDYPDEAKFEVVYYLNSIGHGYSIMLKTVVNRNKPVLDSVFPIWGGANWQEREVYDLLGIVFTGHPNLKRILLHDGFDGHPLRRDYEWVGGR